MGTPRPPTTATRACARASVEQMGTTGAARAGQCAGRLSERNRVPARTRVRRGSGSGVAHCGTTQSPCWLRNSSKTAVTSACASAERRLAHQKPSQCWPTRVTPGGSGNDHDGNAATGKAGSAASPSSISYGTSPSASALLDNRPRRSRAREDTSVPWRCAGVCPAVAPVKTAAGPRRARYCRGGTRGGTRGAAGPMQHRAHPGMRRHTRARACGGQSASTPRQTPATGSCRGTRRRPGGTGTAAVAAQGSTSRTRSRPRNPTRRPRRQCTP